MAKEKTKSDEHREVARVIAESVRQTAERMEVNVHYLVNLVKQEVTFRRIDNSEKKMWCHCQGESESYYVPDGARKDITGHHWRCNDCHKVTQIG